MEELESKRVVKQTKVNTAILKSSNLNIEQLQSYLDHLGGVFSTKAKYFIPDEVNDLPTLRRIANLSERIRKVEHFEGFNRHIKTYTKNQIESSYFVLIIASYLVDKGINQLVFEPLVTTTGKKPDLLIKFQEEPIYIECKTIDTKQFEYLEEHNKMLEILRRYLDVPHQIDIRYRESIPDNELHNLGKELHERVHQVKRDGKIINNNNLEVGVQIREAYFAQRVKMMLYGIMEDLNDNCRYPLHAYSVDGHSISISGPRIDFTKVLRAKFHISRRQYPDNKPYILMVDGNMILGSPEANTRALASAFQPKVNTRFSAAILVNYHSSFDSLEMVYDFKVVPNPFARFPISKEFEKLFSKSN